MCLSTAWRRSTSAGEWSNHSCGDDGLGRGTSPQSRRSILHQSTVPSIVASTRSLAGDDDGLVFSFATVVHLTAPSGIIGPTISRKSLERPRHVALACPGPSVCNARSGGFASGEADCGRYSSFAITRALRAVISKPGTTSITYLLRRLSRHESGFRTCRPWSGIIHGKHSPSSWSTSNVQFDPTSVYLEAPTGGCWTGIHSCYPTSRSSTSCSTSSTRTQSSGYKNSCGGKQFGSASATRWPVSCVLPG